MKFVNGAQRTRGGNKRNNMEEYFQTSKSNINLTIPALQGMTAKEVVIMEKEEKKKIALINKCPS